VGDIVVGLPDDMGVGDIPFSIRLDGEEYTVKPDKYLPIKLLQGAANISQIHNGSTELLHSTKE
jgi:hypothetical protein